MWELVRRWRLLLIVVGLCIIGSSVAELVPPLVVRHVIDQDLLIHRTTGLVAAAALYLAAVLADSAFSFGYSYLSAVVAQRAIAAVRVRIVEHLARVPTAYLDSTPLGEVISRATSDVDTIDELFTSGLATIIGQVVPVMAVMVAMVAVSPLLSAVSLLVSPPLVLATRWLQVRVRDAERATRVAVGRLNTQIAETLGGAETVRAFGRQHDFANRFRGVLRQTLLAQVRSVKYNSLFAPLTNLLYAVAVSALLWLAASGGLRSAGITLGTLTAFILLYQRFFTPIVAVGDQWQSVQAALAGAERVFELLDLDLEPALALGSSSAPLTANITVDNVTHGYCAGHPVLIAVSLRVEAGEHVALVGRTGAGKSTLVSLLGGLSQPWVGSIAAGGRDPRQWSGSERRRAVAIVPQTVQLFTATMRENLTLGDQSITDAELATAVSIAGLAELIASLPEGLDTVLAGSGGGVGVRLSAGERQLVALARALAADPAVVVLDEATAALDASGEAAIRQALGRTAREGGRAVLTVAHRLATAQDADRVIVLDGGRIVEDGSPAELSRGGGRFAALLELQAAGWDWADASVRASDA
ncbi:MAG: ABC transporter ATP-binding protein [Solirubrobacteraceae bacterium]